MSAPTGRLSGCFCCNDAPTFPSGNGVSRRNFVAGGIAALGLGPAAATRPARAQAAPRRIDVHHHYLPPFMRQALLANRAGGGLPEWSVERSLADMDKGGTQTAVISAVQPGVWFGDDVAARKLARDVNDYGAKLVADHKGRFGLFAAIPLPDSEGSLKEIEYALDTLHADGIGLFTSYRDKYLGDPAFTPVLEELNRRKAVVYVHPVIPVCCGGLIKGVPPSVIEFATDTTRTVTSLIFGEAGSAFRFPDIRWIWSHSGGTLPFLAGRLVRLAQERNDARMPDGPLPILRKYNYEIAQGNTAPQLAALMKLVPVSQVLFGTDFPYRDAKEAGDGLQAYGFSDVDLLAIDRGNAIKLMPGLETG
ncbi:MAG TPA: amidohydrolase family protein [Xanthobacteraceae bacterium]|nr:amidohydrolase family protein [Xanthobacteraceae bacterium]